MIPNSSAIREPKLEEICETPQIDSESQEARDPQFDNKWV